MTKHDGQGAVGSGARPPTGTRHPGRRRAKVVVGVVGLAAVLGAGAYVITDKRTAHRDTPAAAGALSAQQHPAGTGMVPLPSGSTAAPAGSTATPSGSTDALAESAAPPEVVASIKAAREKAAKDGVKLTRPLPVASTKPANELARSTDGSLQAGGIVRVVSARSDLTGQQELAWVTSEGVTSHGDNKCTQTFRLTADPTVVRKPNMLLCWRTSATKSVIAIVVDEDGKPSVSKALSKLDEKWRSMG